MRASPCVACGRATEVMTFPFCTRGDHIMSVILRRRPLGVTSLILGLVVLPVAVGCQERTGTVSGTVTLANKQPLPGGRVTFVPTEQGRFPMSSALDEQGHYELTLPV